MSIIKLNEENISDILEAKGITLIKFTASWCGPCQNFAPIFQQVAEKYSTITFAEVDTEAQPALAAEFAVRSVPYLMILKDKVVIYSDSGTLPASALEDLIEQAKAVDLSKITPHDNND
ncbi:MAG: thiol reductase thioredoxin [Legionellales bacterium]|nr:thiol reductase thioredoxin [Legionellales bacterium]